MLTEYNLQSTKEGRFIRLIRHTYCSRITSTSKYLFILIDDFDFNLNSQHKLLINNSNINSHHSSSNFINNNYYNNNNSNSNNLTLVGNSLLKFNNSNSNSSNNCNFNNGI